MLSVDHRHSRLAAFLLFVLLLTCAPASAQNQNATVNGTITDPSGAVVPGAELTLKSLQRGTTAKATSGSDGLYSFPNIEPGTYELSAAAPGFRPLTQTGISLVVGQIARVDLKLEVGTDVQTVKVEADASQLNFENAVHQEGVSPETINELPLVVSGG